MKNIIIFISIIFFISCQPGKKSWEISSPSGNIKAIITLVDKNVFYSIAAINNEAKTIVLPPSPLGLERSDGSFYKNLKVDSIRQGPEITDSYTMISGKQKDLAYTANESVFYFSNDSDQKLQVIFRVFDDGVAFRYIFPEHSEIIVSVLSEKTGFQLPDTSDAWMSPYEPFNIYGQPGYEKDYLAVQTGTSSPEKTGWAFPVLFKNSNYWLFISESGLDGSYCGSHLDNAIGKGLYTIAFPLPNQRYGRGTATPSSALPWTLPWRYVIVGNSVNQIYGSSMGYHLAEPCILDDVSWIKPGRSSWDWWSSTTGRKVKNLKEFIDLAVEMTWEYSLVDAGWENMPDGKIEDVLAYAKQKNVAVNLWYNSGGRRDTTKKDEDFLMFNDDTRNKEMERIASLGVRGIKVDFFSSDKQETIQLYLNILRDAAKYHLLVNFHGCTMPRGWTRTYPNLLTMEAVKGAECYRYFKPYPDMAARFNTVAALVRGSAGPTDYTPVALTNQKFEHKTTFAHEMALAIVYESGIIHMADKPEAYLNLPIEAKEFLKQVPAAWDESKLIDAVPGELFVVARKKAGKWYIAGINGKNEPQETVIKLPEAMNHAVLLTDGENQSDLIINRIDESRSEFTVKMMPRGGFVIY